MVGLVARPLWAATLGVLLSACSAWSVPSANSVEGVLSTYRPVVLQGNVVTHEQAQALTPGMTREQVRAVLGTPLLQSVFHQDRWDYVFTMQRAGQAVQERRFTVFFAQDQLQRVAGDDVLPTEREFVQSIGPSEPPGQDKVVLKADPKTLAVTPPPTAALELKRAPPRDYPALTPTQP